MLALGMAIQYNKFSFLEGLDFSTHNKSTKRCWFSQLNRFCQLQLRTVLTRFLPDRLVWWFNPGKKGQILQWLSSKCWPPCHSLLLFFLYFRNKVKTNIVTFYTPHSFQNMTKKFLKLTLYISSSVNDGLLAFSWGLLKNEDKALSAMKDVLLLLNE